jgi:SAM-dependent methyltransferase
MLDEETNQLIKLINDLHANSTSVLKNLSERKRKEFEFHNYFRNYSGHRTLDNSRKHELFGNLKYYSITTRSRAYIDAFLGKNCKNRIVLDLACGDGEMASKMAQLGAKLSIGIDLSSVSIQNARAAQRQQQRNLIYYVGDAENTKLPDSSVDLVLCSGMLHHLDLSFAFPEIRRILKPGGRLIALEALDINPLIRIYRKLTPEQRTEFESKHIIKIRDLDFGKRFFELGETRYWHVLGYIGAKITFLKRPLDRLDRVLERAPIIQRFAWQITFEFIKPLSD